MRNMKAIMEKYGVPGRDIYELPTSSLTFADGCNYRLEISGIERPSTMEAMINEMDKRKVPVHKAICTVMGATYLDKSELRAMAEMGKSANIELIMTPGPRPTWDIGKQISSPEGPLSGLNIRGSDNLQYMLLDIERGIEAGFRGFLVWDEGVLYLLNQMKQNGDIPKDVVFKVSIFAGHGNAAGAKLLESLGATTFNPVADLNLAQLAALRKAVKIPMDIHIHLFDSFGGFNRTWEAPEIARVASPCYFKIEPGAGMAIYKPWTDENATACFIREKVKFAQIIKEMVEEFHPELKLSAQKAPDLAIPIIA